MSILKDIIYGALRQLLGPTLVFLISYMMGHGWITAEQGHQITVWFNGWIAALAVVACAVAPGVIMSAWTILKAKLKTKIALALPAHHAESPAGVETVKQIADEASIVTVVKQDAKRAIAESQERPSP